MGVQGKGIVLKSVRDVEADLKSGAPIEILQPFSAGTTALQIVYPSSAVRPRRVRVLIDLIVAELASVFSQ